MLSKTPISQPASRCVAVVLVADSDISLPLRRSSMAIPRRQSCCRGWLPSARTGENAMTRRLTGALRRSSASSRSSTSAGSPSLFVPTRRRLSGILTR